MVQDKLIATVRLYRRPDGTFLAMGEPDDRDQAEIRGEGESAEAALQAAGRDYDQAPPGDPETVRM